MRRTHKALATLALGLALATATAAAADRTAIRPSAPTDPAAPAPGVDVGVTLLVGLVGGLVGGAAAMLGWTATTRRRRPRVAAGT
jgi:H+/gluconate symporter-like permease